MTTPRGVRNNNPGNIDYTPRNAWVGQLGMEPRMPGVPAPRFAMFDTAENGMRALGKLLLNYRGKDGLAGIGKPGIDTPFEFANRWAPSNENNTLAYAKALAKRLGVGVYDVIDITRPATLRAMMIGVIVHENGGNPYSTEQVEEGLRRALA
ncbi:structural protein P5 [Pseudomonas syringae]|nr:structural protein P5 [Pseudomonas syringae]MBD8801887.1 structural protein P5 [Pseudomonas syringae]MBD8811763.1 structural protein P5 [Pseudomonas syringae]